MIKPNAIGFDGLSSFATDVDGAIAAAERIAAEPRGAPPAAASSVSPPTPVHRDAGAVAGGLKKVVGWILGIGLILAIKMGIWGAIHAVTDRGPSSSVYSPPTSSDQQSSTVARPSDGMDAMTDNMAAPDATTDTSQDDSGSGATDPAPLAAPKRAEQDDGSLSKPLPGYAALSIAELRYCMAEAIRLSSQKAEMDSLQYADEDRYNRNVDGFNDALSDYNSRCQNRSIMANDRPTATSQIEQQRSQLEMEGRARVQ